MDIHTAVLILRAIAYGLEWLDRHVGDADGRFEFDDDLAAIFEGTGLFGARKADSPPDRGASPQPEEDPGE